MDSQEIRDKILAAINGLIKDDNESATANLHDVLAAKMRTRITPEAPEAASATTEPTEPTEVDLNTDDDVDPDLELDDDLPEE